MLDLKLSWPSPDDIGLKITNDYLACCHYGMCYCCKELIDDKPRSKACMFCMQVHTLYISHSTLHCSENWIALSQPFAP